MGAGATTGVSISLTERATDGTNNGLDGATTLLVTVRVSMMLGSVDELNLLYSTTPGCIIGAPLVVLLISYLVTVSAKTGIVTESASAGSVIAINLCLNILENLLRNSESLKLWLPTRGAAV